MKMYEIYDIPSGIFKGRWIYLIGALSACDTVDTIENYRIRKYHLKYNNGKEKNINYFETESYHVIIVGKLNQKGNTIEVYAMYDSPDITGIGIAARSNDAEDTPVCKAEKQYGLPYPFLYLPAKWVEIPANADKMQSPILLYDKMNNIVFPYKDNIEQAENKKADSIEIVLTDHKGYDKSSPAFYIGDTEEKDKKKWDVKHKGNTDTVSLIFRGRQVCRKDREI